MVAYTSSNFKKTISLCPIHTFFVLRESGCSPMFREIFLRITSYDDHLFLVACTSSSKHCFTVYACTHGTARHGMTRHGTTRQGTAPHRTVCIHEISSLSLCCTGNIIFFVIFTHSIHKFLHLSLIPPHKNHPARRSVRSTPGLIWLTNYLLN